METNNEPSMNDVGTRYEHLKDFLDSLYACIGRMEERGVKTNSDQGKMLKLQIAADVMKSTLDAQVGYNASNTEYQLYKMIDSIPAKAESIEGGRGTPLC